MIAPDKRLFYDDMASRFDSVMNRYDLEKRVALVFDYFWGKGDLKGKSLLDAGCGTGWFSRCAVERGAYVVSLDIGQNLLRCVAAKCASERVAGDLLAQPFPDNQFDFIVCSEA